MLKKILLALIFVITAITSVTHAEDDMKTVASKAYVDTKIETKQLKIPAAGQPNVGAGETVMTYTATGNGQIGERGLYSDISSYDASTDGDKLITASALNATFTNLPTTPTTKLECANQADGCTLWTIVDQTAYYDGLPSGYTRLEYIESTGRQYIDTGIVTQNGIGFDVTFLTNSPITGITGFGAILGGRVASGNNDFQITTYTLTDSAMGTIRNGPSTPVISAKISRNTKLHISLINDVITYDDGTTAPVSSYEYTQGKNIYLFGLNDNGSFTQSGAGCRIYNAKLLVGSNVVFDGIPAKQGTTVGMYDLVSGQFFTNQGTGTFTAGPEVN